MKELRMSAYYYHFESTGIREIDEILSAVACAGKSFHNTEDWNEPLNDGLTPVENIQIAAIKAADFIKTFVHIGDQHE